jgi:hypothetical protein
VYNNIHSPFLTESSNNVNLGEQTFGDLLNQDVKSNLKGKKYMYNYNIHAWRERRKIIKKIQKLQRISREKSNESNFTISGIHSFSTLGVQNGSTIKLEHDEKHQNNSQNFYKIARYYFILYRL